MTTVAEALQIAVGYHRADRFDEARALYLRILAVDPRNAHAMHLLGLAERRLGRPDKALEMIRSALDIQPGMADACYNLGSILAELRRIDEAVAAHRRALVLAPELEDAYNALAALLCDRGGPRDWGIAILTFRRVLRLNPHRIAAYHDLGIALRQTGALEEAQTSQRLALSLQPNFGGACANLGNIRIEMGDPDGAMACFHRSLLLEPEQGGVLYNQGNAQHAAGLVEAAVESYARAARAGITLALPRLGYALMELGRPAEAEQILRVALLSPGGDVPGAIDLLSTLLIRQGRLEETRRFFAEYRYPHATTPDAFRIDCLTAIAESWVAAGDCERAAAMLDDVQWHGSRFFTVKSIACLGRTLARQGRRLERRENPDPSQPRICSSTLATHGRFAHNVLEYVLLRLYAETFGYRLETPDWVGGCYFDLDDPKPSGGLKPLSFGRHMLNDLVTGRRDDPRPDVDILSPLFLFEHREEWRERVQSWLRPRPEWLTHVDPVMQALKARGNTVVALHIRRGDFVWFRYTITETSWYVDWLKALWPTLDRPVLYIATDDPATIADFAEFGPVSLDHLVKDGLAKDGAVQPWTGLEFLQDFHVLMNADVLGVSAQSGYSQLAALLNRNARLFVEPDAAARRIRPYSPWTSPSGTP
ncbi:hypothetical protein VY88_28360 [Azospirillum thiophilum]|uniref:Tetratricopeptide repeat protein n=1 Tax=Azospirillum thiophilum TaxID=528244 RepID=A0AAC8W5L7_9PROT|nr:tetratricopeptide repeat protein [Azospirillum thiophilum]ALG75523.1 hypothetical protein AL072_31685 [Azospirillum thiophilum]KJR62043.1 hypothetical protein VY88_28360 [Azospirillum thiophilum]